MADRASINTVNGPIVFATQNNLRRESDYFCATHNCEVRMSLVANGERQRHFRSEKQADHISIHCTKNNIDFNPDEYTDVGFTFEGFNDFIFGNREPLNIHEGQHGNGHRVVGHGGFIVPHTLKQLYYCLIQRELTDSFGNIHPIGDILVCRDNATLYAVGFTGVKICEFTFFKYADPVADIPGIFYVNIPTFFNPYRFVAKLVFPDMELFRKIKKHFLNIPRTKRHSELAVIMGDWSLSDDTEAAIECVVLSQRQLTYVE